MNDKKLKQLEKISQAVGNSPDLVQGGGGNTSVKFDDTLMAVKASGYQLKQITPSEGFVVVNYKNVKEYYKNVDITSGVDYEKEAIDFVTNNIVKIEGIKSLRPSVEAGFHSLLKKCVIHTHSVYANILCCSQEGHELVGKIFAGKPYACIWIPYMNPGFSLTMKIKDGIDECIKKEDRFPEVIFMENHGLIINSDNCEDCIDLDKEINSLIRDYLNINDSYPEIILETDGEDIFISRTPYLSKFFNNNCINEDYFEDSILYPDQIVYLNSSISLNGEPNKLHINLETHEIAYRTGYNEAMGIEETLLGVLYVINKIKECGLTLKTMPKEGANFIRNWESEKYRKNVSSGR